MFPSCGHAITLSNDINMAVWLLSSPTFAVAKGIKGKQKHFGNDVLDVDATDDFSPDRTFGIDVGMSFGSLNYEPKPLSSLECQSSERTCGEKSSLAMRKPECRTAGKNHVNSSYSILPFKQSLYFSLFYICSICWLEIL